jgi:hypothetical protein
MRQFVWLVMVSIFLSSCAGNKGSRLSEGGFLITDGVEPVAETVADPRVAASETGVDIASLPVTILGDASASDRLVAYDSDAVAGVRISGIPFNGTATTFLNGKGAFITPPTSGTILATGTVSSTAYGITSDSTTDDLVLVEATTNYAGLLGAAKWDEIVANTLKSAGTATELSLGTPTSTTYGITSDGGTDDVVLPQATTTYAGLLSAAKWDEIVANTAKTSAYTNLTSFVAQTAWSIFYSNGAGDVTELPLGADGEYPMSNGPTSAPTFEYPNPVPTVVKTGAYTVVAPYNRGGVIYVETTGTQSLAAIAVGDSISFVATSAVIVTIDPNGTEKILLDGVDAGAGVTIVSTGTLGEGAVLTYYGAGIWYASTNGWAPGV